LVPILLETALHMGGVIVALALVAVVPWLTAGFLS
jgi:hypothetical protein